MKKTKTFSIEENLYIEYERTCETKKLNKSAIIENMITDFVSNSISNPHSTVMNHWMKKIYDRINDIIKEDNICKDFDEFTEKFELDAILNTENNVHKIEIVPKKKLRFDPTAKYTLKKTQNSEKVSINSVSDGFVNLSNGNRLKMEDFTKLYTLILPVDQFLNGITPKLNVDVVTDFIYENEIGTLSDEDVVNPNTFFSGSFINPDEFKKTLFINDRKITEKYFDNFEKAYDALETNEKNLMTENLKNFLSNIISNNDDSSLEKDFERNMDNHSKEFKTYKDCILNIIDSPISEICKPTNDYKIILEKLYSVLYNTRNHLISTEQLKKALVKYGVNHNTVIIPWNMISAIWFYNGSHLNPNVQMNEIYCNIGLFKYDGVVLNILCDTRGLLENKKSLDTTIHFIDNDIELSSILKVDDDKNIFNKNWIESSIDVATIPGNIEKTTIVDLAEKTKIRLVEYENNPVFTLSNKINSMLLNEKYKAKNILLPRCYFSTLKHMNNFYTSSLLKNIQKQSDSLEYVGSFKFNVDDLYVEKSIINPVDAKVWIYNDINEADYSVYFYDIENIIDIKCNAETDSELFHKNKAYKSEIITPDLVTA